MTARRRALARGYDAGMWPVERARLGAWRHRLLALARGDVVELGAGTGLMVPHYRQVDRVVATEPDPAMRARLAARARAARVPVEVVDARAEALPLPDRSADTVVSAFVLCGVDDPAAVLAEVRRVLRPGGRMLFMEHVRARHGAWAARQARLDHAWGRVAGCHLDRDTEALITGAGLAVEVLRREERPFGVPLVPVVIGQARPPKAPVSA
ncbi:MAG: methyltransferase domain-containing protein [Thermoleophilia bacterium]|nr:methyltransferase domain-containing protein [Thermoleophilia bacterium]